MYCTVYIKTSEHTEQLFLTSHSRYFLQNSLTGQQNIIVLATRLSIVPGWDSPYLILPAVERAFTACCCILRDTVLIRFTIFHYHVKANKLLVHAGLCLHIYITLNHSTGRRVYTSHRLLNISSHKLMSFVWPIDSSSSSTSHYAVSRLFLQTFR